MNLKTTIGFTFKNNNVSKSAHIFNVLKSQRIYAVKGLDLKSVPTYLTVKSDVNLSHRLMEQIQPSMGVEPPMMVGCPQAEDIKTQLAHSEKVKHLQTFTQSEEIEKIKHLGASPQIEEKVYPQTEVGRFTPMAEKSFTPMMEAPFTPLGETSNHKFIANLRRCHYPNRALSKILKLALTGYISNGVHSASSGFFVRNISMRSHIVMAKLWRDTFECAGNRLSLSVNPFQLCHHHLTVISKAPISNGVHSHA